MAELRRAAISAIINVCPYVAWLIAALWTETQTIIEHAPSEISAGAVFVVIILPLSTVVVIDLVFYLVGFRQARPSNSERQMDRRVTP
jgi:hypothetical protein